LLETSATSDVDNPESSAAKLVGSAACSVSLQVDNKALNSVIKTGLGNLIIIALRAQ